MENLNLLELRNANNKRQVEWTAGSDTKSAGSLFRGVELAGEVGESVK